MEIEFENHGIEKLARDVKFDGGFERSVVKAFRKRIQLIRNAPDERDFYALRSLKFKKMKGDRAGDYSMRLNRQWRLTLRFRKTEGDKIVVVINIEDYH